MLLPCYAPLWHKDYLGLKAVEKEQTQEESPGPDPHLKSGGKFLL